MTVLIDTYEAAEKLRDSGMPEPQIRAMLDVFRDIDKTIAKAADRSRLEAQIDKLEARLTAKIYVAQVPTLLAIIVLLLTILSQ